MTDSQKTAGIALSAVLFVLGALADELRGWDGGDGDLAQATTMVDQSATRETRELFGLLRQLTDDHMLFGHQDSTAYGVGWSEGRNRSDVQETTGAFPAIHGWDVGRLGRAENLDGVDFERMRQLIKDVCDRGGVNTISWHMSNPITGRGYLDRSGRTNNVANVIPGGSHHEQFKSRLDTFAEFLSELKDPTGRPIPIIFRPWHENNQRRFWWSIGDGGRDYITLWRFTIKYLRDRKQVHNLLYAYSPLSHPFLRSDEPAIYTDPESGYPGDAYVDIIGIDDYSGDGSRILAAARLVAEIADAKGKIAALTEVGPGNGLPADHASLFYTKQLLQPIKADPVARKIAYALVWRNKDHGHFWVPFKGHADTDDFLHFFNDPFTVFESDLRRTREGKNGTTRAENR